MNTRVRKCIAFVGWNLPFKTLLAPSSPIVLLYHGVPSVGDGRNVDSQVLEQHILFLKKYWEFVNPSALDERRNGSGKPRVLLTFDDGFRNNADHVAPILRRHQVPAVFFVCTRHSMSGKYLWFSYLKMLEKSFRGNGFNYAGKHMDMSLDSRRETMKSLEQQLLQLRPHPGEMYRVIDNELPRIEDFATTEELNDLCAGMSSEQVAELGADSLFTIGAHTADHPFLTNCDEAEAERQISTNKAWIESLTGKTCHTIAYPNADYGPAIIDTCRRMGFSRGYAVNRALNYDSRYEVLRTGIYAPPLNELGCKMRWARIARR